MADSRNRTPGYYGRCQERGLALVTVILVVAIVSSIAVFMSFNQQIWFRQTGNSIDRAQSESTYRSVIAFATIVLERDAAANSIDSAKDDWAKMVTGIPIENVMVSTGITDAQGRFNLNNILKDGQPSTEDVGVLRRLFAYHEIDGALVETLLDWMDGDSQTRPGGAEDSEYLAQTTPYRAANAPLADLEELRLVKGFTPEIVTKLESVLTVLPGRTAINVNTAPPTVLGALFTDMALETAESLATRLAQNPVSNAQEIKSLVSPEMKLVNVAIDARSSYFLLRLDTQSGRYRGQSLTLLHRPTSGQACQIVQRSRRPVRMAAADSSG